MMGVPGLAGDPAYPPHQPPMPPLPLGHSGTRYAPGDQQAGLALVAVRQRDRLERLRGPRASASISATAPRAARRAPRRARTSPTGRRRSAPAWSCARAAGCARSPPTSTAWRTASSTTTPRRGALPAGRGGDRRLQWHRHAAPAAELGIGPVSQRAGQFQRPGRQEPDAASRGAVAGYFDDELDGYRGPTTCIWSKEFYETDPSRGFVRGYTLEFAAGRGR